MRPSRSSETNTRMVPEVPANRLSSLHFAPNHHSGSICQSSNPA
jgi:hypothetical protein